LSRRKKITIVSTNLSANGTNRCLRLAQALSDRYDVEIVGATFGVGGRWGEGLWPPLEGEQLIPVRSVRGDYFPGFARPMFQLLKLMDGDLIIACKPRATSFGVALLKRLLTGKPVVLDIDDDELAQTLPGRKAGLRKWLVNPTGYLWTRLVHPLHRLASAKFVVSENFRSRYGGTVVPHPMDGAELDPALWNRAEVRASLGIEQHSTVIGFVGTPSPQKGTDLILEGLARLDRPEVLVMIVGAEPDDPYCNRLSTRFGRQVLLVPPQRLSLLPKYLAAADIVALPQRDCPETWGQMPAKLTDAMAMGKIIIAADRSDIGRYLRGCGVVFEAGNLDDFCGKLGCLLDQREAWPDMSSAARAFFLENLSLQKVGRKMAVELDRLMGERASATPQP